MGLSGGPDEITIYAKQLAWHVNWDYLLTVITLIMKSVLGPSKPHGASSWNKGVHTPTHPLSCWRRVGKGADPWPLYGRDRSRTTVETCESVTGIKQLMGVPPWMATVMMER